ncbi:MAG: sigma-70 family RNA polymerase sigma factor [Pirellulaceae bacterium]
MRKKISKNGPWTLIPDTKISLILRLPQASDVEAWREFVDVYEPFILRLGRSRGLQEDDARELVQRVMVAVARAVDRWQPDAERGRFRAWLFRIARNQLINLLAHGRLDRPQGGTTHVHVLNDLADRHSMYSACDALELDYQRELFRYAAARVKQIVRDTTWQAFWSVAVLEQPAVDVAKALNMSIGAVYIARSRVVSRLRDEVKRLEAEDVLS